MQGYVHRLILCRCALEEDESGSAIAKGPPLTPLTVGSRHPPIYLAPSRKCD